jgi:hypothetical protein
MFTQLLGWGEIPRSVGYRPPQVPSICMFFNQTACFLMGRRIQVSIRYADMRCDTYLTFSPGVAAMTLPEPTAPALAPAYHGLHLVAPSGARTVPEPTASANLLYRVVAVGAALFLVVTLF